MLSPGRIARTSLGLLLGVAVATEAQTPGPARVRVEKAGAGYILSRNGQPYFVNGAGGDGSLKVLAEAGGNSVRTWGADDLGPRLDEARKLGLTVAVGIWLGHERHGFNYNDADQVFAQQEKAREVILRYKDHPAVLLWGIGNEMEGTGKGDNAAIWLTINNLATMAKELDPNHPTMTVIAEVGGDKVKNLQRLCPAVDIIGINSYGGVATLPERYRKAGGSKPYLLTEFGPPGSWESGKNGWGVVPELTSTAKAESYRQAWAKGVEGSGGLALGGYAFTWGHKQEATATWFGMLLPDGSRLGAVDAMTAAWTGKAPANRCPAIASMKVEGPDRVAPGNSIRVKLRATDPEGDALATTWVLQQETQTASVGGDAEAAPPTFPKAFFATTPDEATVVMPKGGGGYRVFAYVRDGHGGAAVANVPVFVDGPKEVPVAGKATLPFVVYDEPGRAKPPYVPTGWMGNAAGLKLAEDCTDRPHAGAACLRAEYRPGDAWVGVVWQSPPSDWGDLPGGHDLKGAKRLTFWARGEKGGEAVNFAVGLINADKPFPDSGKAKLEGTRLTREWAKYAIDLGSADLSRIKSGFVFSLAGAGPAAPTIFYLDDIAFE